MQITELVEKYLEEQGKTRKTKTVQAYRGRLKSFGEYIGAQGDNLSCLTAVSVMVYTKRLKKQKLAVNARYVYLAEAKKFLSWLYTQNYSLVDLSTAIELPRWERKTTEILAGQQIQELLLRIKSDPIMQDTIKRRNRAVLALYLIENLKTYTISNITTIDLNFTTGELRLVTAKRFQKLDKETLVLLKEYLPCRNCFKPRHDYLFVGLGGKKLSGQSINLVRRREGLSYGH